MKEKTIKIHGKDAERLLSEIYRWDLADDDSFVETEIVKLLGADDSEDIVEHNVEEDIFTITIPSDRLQDLNYRDLEKLNIGE